MIGVLRAEEIELEAIARWTSTKLVVQYPKDSTKPRPKTIPTMDQKSDEKAVRALPGQEFSCCAAGATVSGWALAASVIPDFRPSMPPTRCRPIRVSGNSPATITKNCSTSL